MVQLYQYTTFGQTAYQNNTSAFPISNRYTGQIADDETGLYYYGGRYYDPQLGRFIQPDPEIPDPTDSQSFNRYSYCRNNPLNETDPSGFQDYNVSDTGWSENTPDSSFPTPITPNQSIWGQIGEGLQQFGNNISDDLGMAWGDVQTGWTDVGIGIGNVWGGIQGGIDSAGSWLEQNLVGQFKETGSLIAGGFQNGIQSAINPGSQIINPAIGAYNTLSAFASNPSSFISAQYNRFKSSLQTPQGIGQDQVGFGVFLGSLILGGGGAAAEESPTVYSVAFEMRLDPTQFGLSQEWHFQLANQALVAERASNPILARLVPTPTKWGRPPKGWTWQHATIEQGRGSSGVMQLVPRSQHTPGSPFWHLFHPLPGGGGGYSQWAIPAGARPR